jgi:hypothetical protein
MLHTIFERIPAAGPTMVGTSDREGTRRVPPRRARRAATQRETDVFAAFVAAGGSVSYAAARVRIRPSTGPAAGINDSVVIAKLVKLLSSP